MDTGNFQFKILRAKPIPLKIQKLIKAGKLNDSKKEALKQTKFGRFLLKRADVGNIVEITCGQCSSSCQIRTKKPLKRKADDEDDNNGSTIRINQKVTSQPHSISSSSFTKRRKNRNKEVNAGLIIPQTSMNSESDNTSKADNSLSMYELKSDNSSPSTPKPPLPSKPVLSKEKEMDNLRKVLFKSKKKAQQQDPRGKTTLKDFLSSM